MKAKTGDTKKKIKGQISAVSVRVTISFPPTLYGTLEEIAQQKKVSLAWVVRDAAENYITDNGYGGPKASRAASRRREGQP